MICFGFVFSDLGLKSQYLQLKEEEKQGPSGTKPWPESQFE